MNDTEVKRQVFHCIVGVFFVALIYLGIIEEIGSRFPVSEIYFLPVLARPLLLLLIIMSSFAFISRIYSSPIVAWILRNLERQGDRRKFPGKGAFFYVLGAFLVSLFLEKEVLAAAMIIVSIGDSISHIVGREFGRIRHPLSKSKKIEGHLAGGILSGLGASIFIFPPIAFVAAFVSMFIEGVEVGGRVDLLLEDNLIIPIVSSIVIVLLETILL